MVGMGNCAFGCTYCHLRLRLFAGSWLCVIGIVCAAPVTTDTAGRFWLRSCLHLNCMLNHNVIRCCCTLLPPRTTRYSFLRCLCCFVFVALLYAPVLNADLCRECPEGWASFNMIGGGEVGFRGLHDLLLWFAEVKNLFVMDTISTCFLSWRSSNSILPHRYS